MQELSYGIIPVRRFDDAIEVLLVKHASGNHWGFPKGHSEGDINAIEVAKRELREETNLEVGHFISLSPLVENYTFDHPKKGKVAKKVEYYLAFVEGSIKIDPKEILEARFVPIELAPELATHAETKNVCKRAIIYLLKHHFGG